jgi:methyltransferase (TIGR00027 family)
VHEGRASKTAEQNALFRAMEATRAPDAPGADPLASRFLTAPLRQVAAAARSAVGYRLVTSVIDRRWPGVRASVVARTAFIDRLLDEIVRSRCELDRPVQAVVLGAGYDSRAYRLPCLREAVVYEVDHPATQARKQMVVDEAPGLRRDVRHVPTDFHLGGLAAALAAAGHDPRRSTVFLWEGVTNYLTEDAVDATLRWCAAAAPGSDLVFTYVDRSVLAEPERFHGAGRTLAASRRVGEAVTFGLPPDDVPTYLAGRGLELVSDVGAAEYRRMHYGPRADRIRGHEFYRVAHARAAPVAGRAGRSPGQASATVTR